MSCTVICETRNTVKCFLRRCSNLLIINLNKLKKIKKLEKNMKTLLQNEMSQVSGGNECNPAYSCYYAVDSATGKFTTGSPLWFSASPCPTLDTTTLANAPALATTFASKEHKIISSTTNLLHNEATLLVTSDICLAYKAVKIRLLRCG
jgi:hypothetical protein